MQALVDLEGAHSLDVASVGGKAASLAELVAAGWHVPPAVVLTAAGAELAPKERSAAVAAATRSLGDGPFAVRSSGPGEDGTAQSYAGLYETVLHVRSLDLDTAIERCLASGRSERVTRYAGTDAGRLAVIIQRMIEPAAAGVAFTADPVSGDRRTCVVAATRGDGARLVSGETISDEWVVRGRQATPRRRPERALTARQVRHVADTARGIATRRGTPQDVEWAIDDDGELWILQARPMTALPADVSWEPPVRGAFSRAFRFGEWIPEPVTPLFESWLLTRMEDRLHEVHTAWVGQFAPRPYHVMLNGWYFYSLNFLPVPGASLARSLPGILRQALRSPRRVAVMIPPTVRYAVDLYEREWREDLLPRYRAAAARAEDSVDTLAIADLPDMIDELSTLAGEYFASITVVAGSGYKLETNLALFYRRYLHPRIGGSHLQLLAGLTSPVAADHAVESLDWFRPAVPHPVTGLSPRSSDGVDSARREAEAAAEAALADSPRRLSAFRRLLADAQHIVPIREEQVHQLTISWPIMRRAVLRIGEELTAGGVLARADDVFFLTRTEVLEVLAGDTCSRESDAGQRRAERERNATLVPPLFAGRLPRALRLIFSTTDRAFGAAGSQRALVSGSPASPGRVSGRVRIVRSSDEFDRLQDGEVLVAPLTAPAWTPLFARSAAVVTDVGSALAHASIIAREYGIPAVVGCGDATTRLRDGMVVIVDGSRGTVELAVTDCGPVA
ncbi:MAG: PEP/pyruvate-binding domain-containing protein [Chloroflexota bacterium]